MSSPEEKLAKLDQCLALGQINRAAYDELRACIRPAQPAGPAPIASAVIADAVVKTVQQQVTAPVIATPGATALDLGRLANIEVRDGVVKEIHQTINVTVAAPASADPPKRLRAKRVYVAIGREVRAYVLDDGLLSRAPAAVYALPESLGSARSVRLGELGGRPAILIGARGGVLLIDPQTRDTHRFALPTPARHGVNAAFLLDSWLYATHSALGLLRWPLSGGPAECLLGDVEGPTLRGAGLDERGVLLAMSGDQVLRIDLSGPRIIQRCRAWGGEIVGAAAGDQHLYAADLEGHIMRWSSDLPDAPEPLIPALGVKTYGLSLAHVPAGPRLVIATKGSIVRLVAFDADRAITGYVAGGATMLRWAKAAGDAVVAVDGLGTRLLAWRMDHPHRPASESALMAPDGCQPADIALLAD